MLAALQPSSVVESDQAQEAAQKAQQDTEAARNFKNPALLRNYTAQNNYTSKGNSGDVEGDQAYDPQSRQSDPVAKDKETAQSATEVIEQDSSSTRREAKRLAQKKERLRRRQAFLREYEPKPMVQKRTIGEMKEGGGIAAWNYRGGGEDKERPAKRLLKAQVMDADMVTQESYNGDTEEQTVV